MANLNYYRMFDTAFEAGTVNGNRLSWVSVGGTFDVMHKGHWFLLEETFNVGDKAVVGITSDDFVASMRKKHDVESYENRLKEVKEFLKEKGFMDRAEIVPLTDPFGPTIDSDEIEGIVVSEETEVTAEVINKMRVERGKKPLLIFVITMVLADDGKPISSTRVRKQEVDRHGHLIG